MSAGGIETIDQVDPRIQRGAHRSKDEQAHPRRLQDRRSGRHQVARTKPGSPASRRSTSPGIATMAKDIARRGSPGQGRGKAARLRLQAKMAAPKGRRRQGQEAGEGWRRRFDRYMPRSPRPRPRSCLSTGPVSSRACKEHYEQTTLRKSHAGEVRLRERLSRYRSLRRSSLISGVGEATGGQPPHPVRGGRHDRDLRARSLS